MERIDRDSKKPMKQQGIKSIGSAYETIYVIFDMISQNPLDLAPCGRCILIP